MDCKWKKALPAFAASLVAMTSSVNAVDEMQVRNLENRVSALEQRRGANGMINPPSRPIVKEGADLWIQGEALYMQATEDGLSYVVDSDSSAVLNDGTRFVDGRVHTPNYDWNWGFRIGAGYNTPHDGWDFLLNWTWYHGHHKVHETVETGRVLIPTFVPPGTANSSAHVSRSSVDTHLRLNLLDLEMGREFFVSKWLMLRPHVGFRGAWIKRHLDFEASGGNVTPAGTELESDLHNRLRGFGVRGGFDTQWGLGSGWSVFGQLAFSAIYGKQRLHSKYENTPAVAGNPGTERHHAKEHFTDGARAITDLALGLRWDHLFYDDQYRFRLQAAWEQHVFFGYVQDMQFLDDVAIGANMNRAGDLSLSGVSLQARFDF